MADVNINKFRASVVRDGSKPASPGFIVSEGQDPVDPAGTGQNHLPVTIAAAATGLSITESQVLGGAGTTLQYLRGDGSLATFPDLTGYVPYTGANQTVNLNTQQLQAGHTTLTTNGSTETLTINHTSGSGKAINVTKGGNGEGLYVNKTSGSGNAATIVGTLEATTLVKTGGTSSQFLKADGSVDSTSYGTGTVTSVAALTLGTTGTDLTSTVANGTTTPVITLNVPTASATNRGALSSADWTTFNNKASTADLANYLPLIGGTLTGQLNGTSAAFSNTVTAINGFSLPVANVAGSRDLISGENTNTGTTGKARIFLQNVSNSLVIEKYGTGFTSSGIATQAGSAIYDDGAGGISIGSTNISGTLRLFAGNSQKLLISSDGDLTAGNGLNNEFIFQNDGTFSGASGAGTNFILKYGGQNIANISNTGTGQRDAIFKLLDENLIKVSISANNSRGGSTYFNGGGNVLIGKDIDDSSGRLQVSGTVGVTSSVTANSFIKIGGTSSQFLKADGSIDSTTYVPTSRTITINGTSQDLSADRTFNVGTVTSVTASSPLASSGGTAPNITIQQASGSQSGFLSNTDWTTFNSKQNALTNAVTGTGTSGQVAYFNGTNTITSESNLFWDSANDRLGIGTAIPSNPLHIVSNTLSQLNIQAASGNTNAQINLEPTGTGIALIGPANGVNLAFRTNATTRLNLIGSTGQAFFSSPNNLITDGSDSNIEIRSTTAYNTNIGGSLGFGGFFNTTASANFAVIAGKKENATINNLAGYLAFYTRGALTDPIERMRINSAGNVTINNNLTVNSGITTGTLDVTSTTTLATTTGRVLIGTTTNGVSKLRIVGLPTSAAGLSSGDVWNDSGTLKIA